jgi:hypothetical protein
MGVYWRVQPLERLVVASYFSFVCVGSKQQQKGVIHQPGTPKRRKRDEEGAPSMFD